MKWLLLLFPLVASAANELTPSELELLRNASKTAQVEPWDPKRVYPEIIDDVPGYIVPAPGYIPFTNTYMLFPIKDKGHKNASTKAN